MFGRLRIPREIPIGIGALLTLYAIVSGLLDVPTILSLPSGVQSALLAAAVAVLFGWPLYQVSRELRALKAQTEGEAERRRIAVGGVIKHGQELDREIMALKGEARQRPGEYAHRLTEFHARALSVVRTLAPHREGYYLSDAGLPMTTGVVTGWRDTYVAEIRRRILRLNELQNEGR